MINHDNLEHGLILPDNIHSLPVLSPYIPALPINSFSALHLSHVLSHPPDHVLFPFLHGLEGDNAAQNTFFSGAHVRVPKYRGLIWVICEDDLFKDEQRFSRTLAVLRRRSGDSLIMGRNPMEDSASDSEGDSESASASSEFEEEDDEDMHVDYTEPRVIPMDIDADVDVDVDVEQGIRLVVEPEKIPLKEHTHMHPVVQRPSPIHIQIQTANLNTDHNSTSVNTPALLPASSSTSSSASTTSGFFPPTPSITPSSKTEHRQPHAHPTPDHDLVLLTSTFRPSEILRRCPSKTPHNNDHPDQEEGWEFVPARVPEGISLRNFGIQVPIYATLSDIVVYSPLGASPNALLLAERLREAVARKLTERRKAGGWSKPRGDCEGITEKSPHPLSKADSGTHPNTTLNQSGGESPTPAETQTQEGEGAQNLLKYNVFVLDADAEEMRKVIPHLVMKVCEAGVPGGVPSSPASSASASPQTSHTPQSTSPTPSVGGTGTAHTDGPDGHLVETNVDPDASSSSNKIKDSDGVVGVDANTVDFAQREKEEMRDLTKASEIITLFPSGGEAEREGEDVDVDWSTTSTRFDPYVGQVFLGNADDVPVAPMPPSASAVPPVPVTGYTRKPGRGHGEEEDGEPLSENDPFNYRPTNDPARGFGYDICVECHDSAPFPSAAQLRKAEEHLSVLDLWWADRCAGAGSAAAGPVALPPRPPPNANAVIHLPFPSLPINTQTTMAALMPVIRFLEKWVRPVEKVVSSPTPGLSASSSSSSSLNAQPTPTSAANPPPPRRWSAVASMMPHFPPFVALPSSTSQMPVSNTPTSTPTSAHPPAPPRTRSFTSPSPTSHPTPITPSTARTRPLKILIYSSDGYTESSVPALCLLMVIRGLGLPEAYLELQVAKRRSFFVYQADLGLLRRVEGRVREEREREREEREREREVNANGKRVLNGGAAQGGRAGWFGEGLGLGLGLGQGRGGAVVVTPPTATYGRRPAKSVSFSSQAVVMSQQPTLKSSPMMVPPHGNQNGYGGEQESASAPQAQGTGAEVGTGMVVKGRPRASTSPWLPSTFGFGGDHQSWFNDPRFDGSFPSRVLPFLYLGNLNHASNAYMLHALGITHVVSVGECALVPPPHHMNGHGHGHSSSSSPFYHLPSPNARYVPGKGPGGHGSLWFEEREGRIKVLDIKGVCDDGIDTLEPQLEPICDWIDKARLEGGQVLVHCRVGVSRSATVTIAYVMKHLGLPLVDAYLIVRSRRLSVLIQPNMRLLYNLCAWEIKLARERAGEDEGRLRGELARTLSWPYLAKEVHALNEKYLH